jgi:hypothetical protein
LCQQSACKSGAFFGNNVNVQILGIVSGSSNQLLETQDKKFILSQDLIDNSLSCFKEF